MSDSDRGSWVTTEGCPTKPRCTLAANATLACLLAQKWVAKPPLLQFAQAMALLWLLLFLPPAILCKAMPLRPSSSRRVQKLYSEPGLNLPKLCFKLGWPPSVQPQLLWCWVSSRQGRVIGSSTESKQNRCALSTRFFSAMINGTPWTLPETFCSEHRLGTKQSTGPDFDAGNLLKALGSFHWNLTPSTSAPERDDGCCDGN